MDSDAGKLLFMSILGFLFIEVGITGRLGSMLGSVIDPANMTTNVTSSSSTGGSSTSSTAGSPSSSKGPLSISQVYQVAKQGGFSSSQAVIATAIAMAESSGNPNATNTNSNGTVDRGLWQINSVHTQFTASKLFDPLYNAQAAYQVSNQGTNWLPWVTFTSGAYTKFLSEVLTLDVAPFVL